MTTPTPQPAHSPLPFPLDGSCDNRTPLKAIAAARQAAGQQKLET